MNAARDEAVARIVREHGPLTESAVGMHVETLTGEKLHGELVATSLRRLQARNIVVREGNLFGPNLDSPQPTEPAAAPTADKCCTRCGGQDFYPSGGCRPCGKADQKRHQERMRALSVARGCSDPSQALIDRKRVAAERSDRLTRALIERIKDDVSAMPEKPSGPVRLEEGAANGHDGPETVAPIAVQAAHGVSAFAFVIAELEAKRAEIDAVLALLRNFNFVKGENHGTV